VSWHKFLMMEEAIASSKYAWVWYINDDFLITNATVKLKDIIYKSLQKTTEPDEIDYVLINDE
jgi:hypothetical protein